MVWGTSDLWTEKFFQNLVITNTMIEIAQCERGMFCFGIDERSIDDA